MSVLAPVSWGELIDKVTILLIKAERIQDAAKVANVRRELEALRPLREQAHAAHPDLAACEAELKAVNEALWEVEDEIRLCERQRAFDARFIELARAVYRQNDLRAQVKRRINELLGSDLIEEKSYQSY
ncbi:hypothetical protein GETHLI_16790 [Geothrix limicola]|uniref:Uncharacterized protein n=1 Tax=Geothrix limicola TaxID=2927978 RepID=A0ABQ5QEB1_9BACT|nr:DUF6165 family protein [Geothrix limicola]GLH73177.1 hypothetical protein GETHLI_16790 [Geothrix limicola]